LYVGSWQYYSLNNRDWINLIHLKKIILLFLVLFFYLFIFVQ